MQSLSEAEASTKHASVEPLSEASPTDEAKRWLGRRVGNYVIDRPLARGGMGSVYVARHPQLGREVAVKFLAQEVSSKPELASRFLAEARVTASLNHPNIVEILDFGELDGVLYYVMELLRGKSLRVAMREQRRFSVSAVKAHVEQICWALDAAHRAGIVHRDLKPANVLVLEGEPLRLKLLDFGVAKLLSAGTKQTRNGQILGTATHMAPEQAMGDLDRVTARSDLYSLGAIAYEMLAGEPVFDHESDVMLMVMHVRDPVRPLRGLAPDVSEPVAQIVEACLAKNPAERPASARALAEELGRAVETSAAAPAPATPLPPDAKRSADQPTRIADASPAPAPPAVATTAAASPIAALGPGRSRPHRAGSAPTLAAVRQPLAARSPSPPTLAAVTARSPSPPGLPAVADAPPSAEATLQTLLQRLQRRGDFPAFGRIVGEVSQKADANGGFSATDLGQAILNDYALTAKLLRIVNSNYARRFGGKIYSVQHAILILGFDRVRSLALSISLFKTSGSGKEPERVTESAISALVSSEIARSLAEEARVNEDEATICAMFRNLGRHLVLVYLPELYDRILKLVETQSIPLSAASERVLGATFSSLGATVAKNWQLPAAVVSAMNTTGLPDHELVRAEDRLNALTAFANELCDIVTREPAATRESAIDGLLGRSRNLFSIGRRTIDALLAQLEGTLTERYTTLVGRDLKSSRFVVNVSVPPGPDPDAGAPLRIIPARAAKSPGGGSIDARIAELKTNMERGAAPDAVLSVALGIVSDQLGVAGPLVLTLAPNRQALVVRFALREDLEGLKRELKFPLRGAGRTAQLVPSAYHSGRDLSVKDCFEKSITDALPLAYYEVLGSPAFAVYACLGKGFTPALVLADFESAEALPDAARVAGLAELRPLIVRAAARS